MKKLFVILILFFSCIYCFAQDFNYSPRYFHDEFKICNGSGLFEFMYDDYFIKAPYFDGKSFQISNDMLITKCSISEDKGYKYVEYKNYSDTNIFNFYWIFGEGIIIRNIYERTEPIKKETLSKEVKQKRLDFIETKKNSLNGKYNKWEKIVFIDDGIKSINASSELIENETFYSAKNLLNRIYTLGGEDWMNYCLDYITSPWIEGVPGYGVGEYLDIEFDKPVKEIQILNGFVDFDRKYLFKENSRVKKILIESMDGSFSKEYELKDLVEFTDIIFPKLSSKIRITIKDVYKGEKYDDTCLSAIIAIDPDKPSFEEEKQTVITILKANGIWNKLMNMIENNIEYTEYPFKL